MWMLKRIKVALYERALVYRDRDLERVLGPGKYWLVGRNVGVQVHDVSKPELELARADVLLAGSRALLEPFVQIVELGDREVGIVYKNERLSGVLAPGARQLYWRGAVNVRVEVRDIANEYTLDADTARVLTRAKGAAGVSDAVSTVEVPDTAVGLLIVDGELRGVLPPGLSAHWKFQRALRVELSDRRLQAMEVSGQEILTRDKVSLRVNLTAMWQVTDAVKARATISNLADYVYKELQFALREAVLMEQNPTLLRLKELETLEKVTEKIGSLTVYDGLEGVLKNMVPRLS